MNPYSFPLQAHVAKLPHGLVLEELYTVTCAVRADEVKTRTLRGEFGGSEVLGTREVTTGTRMVLKQHDARNGRCYLEIYNTGAAVRLDETLLTPWKR